MMHYHSKDSSSWKSFLISGGYITVKQYAEITNSKLSTVYKRIARGKIPFEKIGGTIYINANVMPEISLNDLR